MAPNPNTADLQKQYATLQQLDQQGQRDLQQILQPVQLSQAYVEEQIQDVLPKAVEAAASKKGVTLILNRDAGAVVMRDPAYNMNADVTAELDALLPVAQLSPPPGWLPREERERQAQAQAAQAAASGQPAPTAAPTSGAIQNSHSWPTAAVSANSATPVERAGLTDVLVTGIEIRWISVRANPIASGAKPVGAARDVDPRITTRKPAVRR